MYKIRGNVFISQLEALNYIKHYLLEHKGKIVDCDILNCAKRLYNRGKISQLILEGIEKQYKGA